MGKHKPYQGHKNYAAWNVALYLFNDEPLYRMMCAMVRSSQTLDRAAGCIYSALEGSSTPDGVKYTRTNIRLALQGWSKP